MENMIRIFENEEFGKVRTVIKDGEPWLVGKDVAEILGYSNTRDALSRHVDTEDKTTVVISDSGSNYKSKTTMIKLRAMCTDEVKRINGIINFEKAVRYQRTD